ncbi:MAG TPA: hypothetical protein VIY09_03170 [Rhizomicrobium sp.]
MTWKLARLAALGGLLCVPFEARAQALDMTPYSGRILSDPNYLPMTGQIYGTTAYTHGWTDGISTDYAGAETSSFHIGANTLDQLLAYGVTDDLSVNASLQYVPINYREIDYANGRSQTLDSSGISDPTFGATYRLLDQSAFPVDLDLVGSYTPNLIDAHTATAFEDGTVARGGQAGTAGAALGYETRSFGIRGAFNANFYGASDTYNLANGDTNRIDGFTNYTLSVATQTRLSDLFSVNAGLDHVFQTNESAVNLTSGAPRYSEPGDETALQLALNYNFIPNAFVISATYAHDFYDVGRTFYDNPLADSQSRDKNSNIVGVKLYYDTP